MNKSSSCIRSLNVWIPCGSVELEGDLATPEKPSGLIIFAHGSGSSRFSPRNQFVARKMQERGFATLLFDLLTEKEAKAEAVSGSLRFDIELLTGRLVAAVQWIRQTPSVGNLAIRLFGASTGAAAALTTAALLPGISAVVSRGGRSDLAGDHLKDVIAPTLLIAGSYDGPIIHWNQTSLQMLQGIKKIEIIPGASHLFEEPGTLEEASRIAADWLTTYLRAEA